MPKLTLGEISPLRDILHKMQAGLFQDLYFDYGAGNYPPYAAPAAHALRYALTAITEIRNNVPREHKFEWGFEVDVPQWLAEVLLTASATEMCQEFKATFAKIEKSRNDD